MAVGVLLNAVLGGVVGRSRQPHHIGPRVAVGGRGGVAVGDLWALKHIRVAVGAGSPPLAQGVLLDALPLTHWLIASLRLSRV